MSRIIAITNQKGGVGKTTTSVNLAASLSAVKRSVLLIDIDPQSNATTGMGVEKHDQKVTLSQVLLGEGSVEDLLISVATDTRFDLLPSSPEMTVAEVQLMDADEREFQLKRVLEPIKDNYEYILIDCPPSLNMLTVNALVAADEVIIPMQCEYYALEGLSALVETISSIQQSVNPKLEIKGLLRTMFDPRSNLARDVSNQLNTHFADKLYNTSIPRNIRLAEAPSHGMPVLNYDKNSRGTLAYLAFAAEMLRKDSAMSAHTAH